MNKNAMRNNEVLKQVVFILIVLLMVQFLGGADLYGQDSPGPMAVLEAINRERHKGYLRIVFQFGDKVLFEKPYLRGNEVFIRLKNVTTKLAPFRQYISFNSWVRLEKAGKDLDVLVGLPENFLKLRYYFIQKPYRFELNLFIERNPPASLPVEAADFTIEAQAPVVEEDPMFLEMEAEEAPESVLVKATDSNKTMVLSNPVGAELIEENSMHVDPLSDERLVPLGMSIGTVPPRSSAQGGAPESKEAVVEKRDTWSVIGKEGDWYLVELEDGRTGWSHQSQQKPLPTPEAKEPGPDTGRESHPPSPEMAANTAMDTLAPYAVEDPGLMEEAVSEKKETGNKVTLRMDIGRVREEPSLDSKIKFRLRKGDNVSVSRTENGWYLVELEDGRTGWSHQSLFFKSDQTRVASLSNQLAETKKSISLPETDRPGPGSAIQSADFAEDSPGPPATLEAILEAIRGARHKDFSRIVFQFGTKALLEKPIVRGNVVCIRLKNVTTELTPFRQYRSFNSWVRLEKAGADLEVLIGLPENFLYMNHLVYKDPDRLVLNFFTEGKPPPLPIKVANIAGDGPVPPSAEGYMPVEEENLDYGEQLTDDGSKSLEILKGPVVAQSPASTEKEETKEKEPKPATDKPAEDKPAKEETTESQQPAPPPPRKKPEPIETDEEVVIQSEDNELMSFNFLDVDIREALSALARHRKINIVRGPEISGKVSLDLYKVSLNKALEAITLASGFSYHKLSDLYYFYKPKADNDPLADKLQMRTFKLEYADITKVQEILDSVPGKRLIKIHEPSKTIIVEDLPENIRKIETIINYLDKMPKQVMIEAKILEVSLTDDMSLGVNWRDILGDVTLETGGFSRATMPTGEEASVLDISPMPTTGSGLFGSLVVAAGLEQQFTLALDALKTKTTVNTLSTPKILAIHGKPAIVQVGGQQGYKETSITDGTATETVKFIETGVMLEITPLIDDKNNVLLEVKPEISSAEIEAGFPVVKTTKVSTWLLAKNGETVFIGGLIRDTKTRTRDMIPCLGGIPGLGVLFGKTSRTMNKTELIVLITPKVLDAERKPLGQEAIEKTKKVDEEFKKEPLPHYKELLDFFFP